MKSRRLWLVLFSGLSLFPAGLLAQENSNTGISSFIQLASAKHGSESSTSDGDSSSSDLYSSGNDFIRVYGGYDYSLLGNLISGLKATTAYYLSFGATAVSSTSDNGIFLGAEYGKRLDASSELSLRLEFISSQADTFAQTNPDSYAYESFGPNLADLSLQYTFDILRGNGNRTSLSVGAGWYHTIVDYTDDENSLITPVSDFQVNGAFTGDTAGGTLGLSEKIQLGPQFGLDLFVQGRWVQFSRVQASNLTGYDKALGYSGPYSLASINAGGGQTVFAAVANGVIDSSGGQAQYVTLDYSGIDGGLSVEISF